MKKIAFYLLLMVVLLPATVFAKEDNDMVLESQIVKYYKTTYNDNLSTNSVRDSNYYTEEVSEEEYLSAKDNNGIKGNGVVTTVYKKLTTSIYNSGNYYQYKAVLEWLNIPSVRSYDVIAIGHLSNVKYSHGINFSQYYCVNGGGCTTTGSYYSKTSNTGCGATFKLPEGNLSVLKQTFYYYVAKNTTATITYQAAYGDYSHATSNVTSSQGQNYTIGTSGIVFNGTTGNYYDNISPAVATWSGSW